jgi:DNA repair photolyase
VEAPPVSARIEAIKKLNDNGISTYAFIGPVLPYFIKSKNEINKLLDELQKAGVKEVWFEHIHLNSAVKARLFNYLKVEDPKILEEFERADNAEYREDLEKVIYGCLEGRGLKLGLGKILYHKDLPKLKISARG